MVCRRQDMFYSKPLSLNLKLLELINEFSKLAGCKTNIQNSTAVLYTNNELSERARKQFCLKSQQRLFKITPKVCLVNAMVFPVVKYGCESWTIKKAEC